ncbi:MAG: pitrilysin family protein, partial [Gammaproteobacteria bacterium]
MKNLISEIITISILICIFSVQAWAETHEYALKNGLRLIVKEDHRAPVVVSQVWYKVGSSYEHDGITGTSHALEHMMFKGTKNYPAGEFSRIISENGGRENAFTGSDYTAYFQTLEKSRLAISFELEADRMRNLILPEEEFGKEIEVVKEERRMRTEDNPQSYTHEVAKATAFQTSPYRNPIIGWMSDLEAMTIDTMQDWYQQWYAPNNATVVVVGDVDPEAVYRLAKRYFEPLPAGKPMRAEIRPEVEQRGLKRVKVRRPAELPYFLMIYKTPVLRSDDKDNDKTLAWEPYALEVLAGILDGGSSARFASRLVRGKEIAASVSVGYNLISRMDYALTITGTPSQDHTVAELEQAIQQEINDLKANLVAVDELERVKAQVVSGDVYERDSIFYQAMVLGMLETVGLSWRLADEYVERVKSVTPEQIRQVAGKYLVDDRLT